MWHIVAAEPSRIESTAQKKAQSDGESILRTEHGPAWLANSYAYENRLSTLWLNKRQTIWRNVCSRVRIETLFCLLQSSFSFLPIFELFFLLLLLCCVSRSPTLTHDISEWRWTVECAHGNVKSICVCESCKLKCFSSEVDPPTTESKLSSDKYDFAGSHFSLHCLLVQREINHARTSH